MTRRAIRRADRFADLVERRDLFLLSQDLFFRALAFHRVAQRAPRQRSVGLAFNEKILRADFHRFDADVFILVAREHDHREARRLRPHLGECSFPEIF